MTDSVVDWEAIRADYENTTLTQEKLATKYNVSQGRISTRAKEGGWKRQASINALRESLRNGRTNTTVDRTGESTYSDSTGAIRNPTGNTTTSRSDVQNASGTNARSEPGKRKYSNDERGNASESERIGQTDRRFSGDYGSHASNTPESEQPGRGRARGRLVAEEAPPTFNTPIDPFFSPENVRSSEVKPRNVKSKPRKERNAFTAWWQQKGTLSDKEASELEEPLKACLLDFCQYIDEYIWIQTEDTNKMPIWSDADGEDAGAIARVLLRRAKVSPVAATVVRGIIAGDDYFTMAVFLGPRVIETHKRLKNAPKREKQAREPRKLRLANENNH